MATVRAILRSIGQTRRRATGIELKLPGYARPPLADYIAVRAQGVRVDHLRNIVLTRLLKNPLPIPDLLGGSGRVLHLNTSTVAVVGEGVKHSAWQCDFCKPVLEVP